MPRMRTPREIPIIWNYFEESENNYKMAVCNFCQRELSYRTTITNLKSHLKQKHIDAYNDFVNFSKNARPQPTEQKPSNDESDVEESPNNTYQEVVYLYDSDSKSNKKDVTPVRATKKLEPLTPMTAHKEKEKDKEKKEREKTEAYERRKRRRMSTYEPTAEEPPKTPEDSGDEELDKFGKYVVCLMKTIPKELGTQLQLEMINLIMTAKIKFMAKPTEPSDTGEGFNSQSSIILMNDGKIQHMEVTDDNAEKTTEGDANDTQSNVYEEVVYLQDSETKTVKEIRVKKMDGQKETEHRKRRLMSTFDDTKVDTEEIEKFGKYVTCLMKTVPNDLCTQLQMDIINTIMRGKMRYLAKQSPVPPSNVIEKTQTEFQPSIIVTVANDTAHMPILESNPTVAAQA